MKPVAFGLTGGIASGKSTVSKTFKAKGIPIVDADEIARVIVRPGSPGLYKIRYHFGDEYLTPSGELDRVKLGKLVFEEPNALRILDMHLGPLLRVACHYEVEKQFDAGHKLVCFDAPLLIEKNLQDMYRPVVVVHCAVETQIKRMKTRNGFTEKEARARLAAQFTTEERLSHADYTISTDNTMDETRVLSEAVLAQIMEWAETR